MSYPEHEKLQKIKDLSQAIHDFLEWAGSERRISLGQHALFDKEVFRSLFDDEPSIVQVEQFVPFAGSLRILLADHFGIDLEELEREKQRMLDEMRAAQ